jgi:hypothetical protein
MVHQERYLTTGYSKGEGCRFAGQTVNHQYERGILWVKKRSIKGK